jgi:hypothetical protein
MGALYHGTFRVSMLSEPDADLLMDPCIDLVMATWPVLMTGIWSALQLSSPKARLTTRSLLGPCGNLIALIRQMWQANPTWGSPRIQAELAKLGIQISDSTIRKYRPERRRSTSTQTWKTFLHNHAKELVAVDFFTVPTATFRVLYVFLVLALERRKVLHFHITQTPSAGWAAQQMVEAFPFITPARFPLRDRDSIFGVDFVRCVEGLGLEQKVIAPESGIACLCDHLFGGARRAIVLVRVGNGLRDGGAGGLGDAGNETLEQLDRTLHGAAGVAADVLWVVRVTTKLRTPLAGLRERWLRRELRCCCFDLSCS